MGTQTLSVVPAKPTAKDGGVHEGESGSIARATEKALGATAADDGETQKKSMRRGTMDWKDKDELLANSLAANSLAGATDDNPNQLFHGSDPKFQIQMLRDSVEASKKLNLVAYTFLGTGTIVYVIDTLLWFSSLAGWRIWPLGMSTMAIGVMVITTADAGIDTGLHEHPRRQFVLRCIMLCGFCQAVLQFPAHILVVQTALHGLCQAKERANPSVMLFNILLGSMASLCVETLVYAGSNCCIDDPAPRWLVLVISAIFCVGSVLSIALKYSRITGKDHDTGKAIGDAVHVYFFCCGLIYLWWGFCAHDQGTLGFWAVDATNQSLGGGTHYISLVCAGALLIVCSLLAIWLRARVHGCIAQLVLREKRLDGGAHLASLYARSSGLALSDGQMLGRGAEMLRRVRLDAIIDMPNILIADNEDFTDEYLLAQSEPCKMGEIDFFISHAWMDDPDEKLVVLKEFRKTFFAKFKRSPWVWFDKFCIDQSCINDQLLCLPVYLMACNRMLIMCGEWYARRLWCVWELHVHFTIEQDMNQRVLMPLGKGDCVEVMKNFSMDIVQCRNESDKEHIRKIVDAGVGIVNFEKHMRALGHALSVCLNLMQHWSSARTLQGALRGYAARKVEVPQLAHHIKVESAGLIQGGIRGWVARKETKAKLHQQTVDGARRIQAGIRGRVARKEIKQALLAWYQLMSQQELEDMGGPHRRLSQALQDNPPRRWQGDTDL